MMDPKLHLSVTGHLFLTLSLGGLGRLKEDNTSWGPATGKEENVGERNKYAIRTAREINQCPVLFSQDTHN